MKNLAPAAKVVLFGLLAEAGLVGLAYVLAAWRGIEFPFVASIENFALGLFAASLLILINLSLLYAANRDHPFLRPLKDFVRTVVSPLAKALSLPAIVVLSVAAGVGEEILFRGVLQHELGLFLSSIIFALAHFGTATFRLPLVALLYVFASLFLGSLFAFTGSLVSVITAHITYDFFALVALKQMPVRGS